MSIDNHQDQENLPESSVRVAVRIRPQTSKEIIANCEICTIVTPNEPQVCLGKDAFTFDYVFDSDSKQVQIYETCVKNLVEGCFNGYNATVLAYGQTGSGKTYTMGTGFDPTASQEPCDDGSQGIVPRAVHHLFDGIEKRKQEAREGNQSPLEFKVTAQFLELYNDDIIDLLNESQINNNTKQIKIHQENDTIQLAGVTSRPVTSVSEAFDCLRAGALVRTTASTQMNTSSSRSHAIFTLSIHQTRVASEAQDVETLTAKFHFVDLAGSERLKRTGATGDRAKEGISINSGLMYLGNVISALGDKSKKASYIPYRDSKLTRLLQDSLGGNSQTLMIACISPSGPDYGETLSTLRYANRAKNIKNKVVVNHDTSRHTIALLRKENQELKLELSELKQGKRMIGNDGTEYINDMYHENAMLSSEIQSLKTRIKILQEANERLIARNAEFIADSASPEVKDIVQRYLTEIEELRLKLLEMEETCSNLRRNNVNRTSTIPLNESEISSDKVIEEAKREVKKLKAYTKLINNGMPVDSDSNAQSIHDSCDSNETDGDEDVLDSSEDASEDNNIEKAKLELVQLNDDISTKELLIAELEKSQRKMQSLKHHYESKLIQLQNQIAEIEKERDQVMIRLTQGGNKTDEKTKKVRDDYDKRIKTLLGDLKKLQDAKKEHAIAMRNQAKYEQQVRKLRNEVSDMKKQKVNVMNKMKEEASRHRVTELQSNKKIAQLTKQERLKDVKIKNLEVENSRIKQTLKRKDAEVKALKIRSKGPASRLLRQSPKFAKNKWGKIEHEINQLIATRQAIWNYEQQMDRDIAQRTELSEHLNDITLRLREARRRNEQDLVHELSEDVETISSNIQYLDQNIGDCQSTILQLEDDLHNNGDIPNLDIVISNSDHIEMKYLFQKIMSMLINQTQQVNMLSEELRQWEYKYRQVSDTSRIREELLDHVLNTSSSKLERDLCGGSTETFIVTSEKSAPTKEQSRIPSPIMMPPPSAIPAPHTKQKQNLVELPSDNYFPQRLSTCEKARRLTRTPQELLFDTNSNYD